MSRIEEVGYLIADHMDEILALFKPGAKITVLVRAPGYPERDLCMTSDELPEVAAMIERRRAAATPTA